MLDQLPLELIQLIVHLALPSHYSPSTYRERQNTLLALCETCRAVRDAVQPMLFEVVEVGTRRGMNSFLEAVASEVLGHVVDRVRIFSEMAALTGRRLLHLGAIDVEQLVQRCPFISVLQVTHQKVDLAQLQPLNRLVAFHCGVGVLFVSKPFFLPALTRLSLSTDWENDAQRRQVLDPTAYPSLRVLTLNNTFTSTSVDNLLPAFFPQVSYISLEVDLDQHLPPAALLSHPCVLTDVASNVRLLSFLHHGIPVSFEVPGLQHITRTLQAAPSITLKRLYLADDFLPDAPEVTSDPTLATALAHLREACASHSVQIGYFDHVNRNVTPSWLPDFLECCDRLKAEAAVDKIKS